MTYRTRRDADFLPCPDYFELLERERDEARAILDEAQARALDEHIRAQARADSAALLPPPAPPTWLILAPVILLTFIYAAEFARAGAPVAALVALALGGGVAWLVRRHDARPE